MLSVVPTNIQYICQLWNPDLHKLVHLFSKSEADVDVNILTYLRYPSIPIYIANILT